MRILQVATTDSTGGAERVAQDLHAEFLAQGQTSRLAVGTKSSEDDLVLSLDNAARSRGLRGLRNRVRDVLGVQYRDFPASWELGGLGGVDWDVLCLHNLHGGYFDVAALPSVSATSRTVLVGHDMWLATGHCAHAFDCTRWRAGCGRCPYKGTYPAVRVDFTRRNHEYKRRALADADVVIVTPSNWLAEIFADSHLRRKPRHVIRNPVDLAMFAPGGWEEARRRLALPLDREILLYPARAARSNEFKDFAAVLRIAAGIQDRGSLVLAFSGGSSDRTENDVLEVASVSDPNRMRDYYLAADLVVYPCRAETSPLALIEAAACSRPAIAMRTGGCPELICDGETGVLVDEGDVEGMLAAVRELLDSPARRHAMGEAGRRRVEARHDRGKIARQWLQLFESIGAG